MFNWFGSSSPPPVPDEKRKYFEARFNQIRKIFSEKVLEKSILTPQYSDFPLVYDGSENSAWETMRIICKRFEINSERIHLDFFSQGPAVLDAGATQVFLQQGEKEEYSAGLYWGEDENGKYHIWIENALLKQPEQLASVIAHELSHVLLIGEGLINPIEDKDHELITEILCAFFGFGILCGQTGGYLRQQSWSYLLALYAFSKKEKNPEWAKHLTPSMRNDLKTSLKWLNETDAGEQFLNPDNNSVINSDFDMENKSINGKWVIRSVYGNFYGDEEGDINLWEMDLNENAGNLTGAGNDILNKDVIADQTKVEGAADNNMIMFSRHYNDYEVLYTGRYNDFLDCFQGSWKIKFMDENNKIAFGGAGTFEMKRM